MRQTAEHACRLTILGFALAAPLALCAGCAEKESQPEVISLEGKIEKIERQTDTTGKITVVYYNEKQKQEVPGTGVVTKETEIMIDGAVATLKDLREGERVRGEVRVDKKDGKKVQTALKIYAERGKSGTTSGG